MKFFRIVLQLGKIKRMFEEVNDIISELEHKLQSQSNQFAQPEVEMIIGASYLLRKNILDVIESEGIDIRVKIHVKPISSIKIRLHEAIDITITRLMRLSDIMEGDNEVTDILERGELFHALEEQNRLFNN